LQLRKKGMWTVRWRQFYKNAFLKGFIMSQFSFETAPKIICEQGGANRLGEISKGLGISRLFLVTDAGLIKAKLIDGALASLAAAGVAAVEKAPAKSAFCRCSRPPGAAVNGSIRRPCVTAAEDRTLRAHERRTSSTPLKIRFPPRECGFKSHLRHHLSSLHEALSERSSASLESQRACHFWRFLPTFADIEPPFFSLSGRKAPTSSSVGRGNQRSISAAMRSAAS